MYSETMLSPFTSFMPAEKGHIPWYQHCNCCPYGYHIDLDFVRYCESIGEAVDRTGSIKRRKDRRRQRKSMEVLLGLEPSAIVHLATLHPNAIAEESPCVHQRHQDHNSLGHKPQPLPFEDGLDEAVSDFERTLQRSKKLPKNLPDVTAVYETIRRAASVSSMSSASGSSMTVLPSTTDGRVGRDFDTASEASSTMTPGALHNIREQMVLSLERTKQLEQRVKIIPTLQAQVYSLKQEKRQLLTQMKAASSNAAQHNGTDDLIGASPSTPKLPRSTTFTIIRNELEQKMPQPTKRDCAITCAVLTRNVGVGHQLPHTKTTATCTSELHLADNKYADKWLTEKAKFLDSDINYQPPKPTKLLVIKGTQTTLPREKCDIGVQTLETPATIVHKSHMHTQTFAEKKRYSCVGVSAVASTCDKGISADTIDQIPCPKCNPETGNLCENNLSVSLASLIGARSKSFNFGEEKRNFAKSRTVGCQYEAFTASKACQHQVQTYTRGCQKELKVAQKGVQHDGAVTASKNTDTHDLAIARKHIGCNTHVVQFEAVEETGRDTEQVPCAPRVKIDAEKEEEQKFEGGGDETKKERKAGEKERNDKGKDKEVSKDDSHLPSRIPRLQQPVTPIEVRKFRRQDTYTKIPSTAQEAAGLSGLSFKCELETPFTKLKHNYNLPEVPPSHNGLVLANIETETGTATVHPLSETALCHPVNQSQRIKKIPSKEMQGAMKVLNDSLQKGQIKNLKKSATNIVQQEWFQISSLINANPLDVEDCLDCFEEISYDLLHYIVNMVDASGNTAMHYAVSHGNFDVVSILLDSKVCDINQPNKAGYTSVMLVSLAEVRSPTHANVVRRLFQLADVNIRAKQHGQTALMLAVSHGRIDMVQMLLEAGADINIQDEDGSTALMCAAEHGHIDIVKHFLGQPDCDSTITDVDGSTALKIAMEAGHRHIGVLLYAHERSTHGGGTTSKHRRNKSASGSPKPASSPLLPRSSRALNDNKTSK